MGNLGLFDFQQVPWVVAPESFETLISGTLTLGEPPGFWQTPGQVFELRISGQGLHHLPHEEALGIRCSPQTGGWPRGMGAGRGAHNPTLPELQPFGLPPSQAHPPRGQPSG